MLLSSHLWALPPSLLLLLSHFASSSLSQNLRDSSPLRRDVKYFPEHEAIVRREMDVQQRLQKERPVGMRKMSDDAGEKFYLHDWVFADEATTWANETIPIPFSNSFPLHSDRNTPSILPRYLDLRRIPLLQKRDYQCPAGTSACTAIARPDSCCSIGSTCQIIVNIGLGDVGCCPAEETCGGSVSECGGNGYTDCPSNAGGGCCIPGYECDDEGCVQTNFVAEQPPPPPAQDSTTTVTSVVTVTASGGGLRTLTTTVIVPAVATTPSTTVRTSSVPPPPPSPETTTITSTTRTTSTRPATVSCPTDFRSCPASLGGGCCHTDRACGYGRECPALTTSGTFSPPARPTDDATTTTSPSAGCPNNFYACSAYHEGGCCQVDRNCDKTYCPTIASTTLVNGSPTIVAQTGSGITAPGNLLTGACAKGWLTCAPADGGGCCQVGFTCGPIRCTATQSGGGVDVAGKIAPNTASMSKATESMLILLTLGISSMALGLGILL